MFRKSISIVLTFVLTTGFLTVNKTDQPVKANHISVIHQTAEEEQTLEKQSYVGELADKLYEIDPKNTLISALSLDTVLSMLTLGSEGSTKAQLESYIDDKSETLSENYEKLLQSYENNSSAQLYMANAVFSNRNNGFEFKKDYINQLDKIYNAQAIALDFSLPETVPYINKWCSQNTHGMIPKIVEDTIEDKSAIMLNAFYFNSKWEASYEDFQIEKKIFTNLDGSISEKNMLKSKQGVYLENDFATGFKKSYTDGFSFVGILPKAEGDFTFKDLDIQSLLDSETYSYSMEAILPEFQIADNNSLKDALSASGLDILFSSDASFPYISDANLQLSDIIQKTAIDVNRTGTKAAAITEVEMVEGSAFQEEKEIMTVELNRPFAFAIYDEVNDKILFLGKIIDLSE